jgi:membrane-bound lytic murein transglycosylase A
VDARRLQLVPVDFAKLDGWADDDHAAAFRAYLNSCRKASRDDAVCTAALACDASVDREAARAFFETHFQPHAIEGGTPGFVTGYYEPEVNGARTRDARFSIPVYGRPDDLVTLASDTERARFNDRITGFRDTAEGRVPYFTRAEIEAGALEGRGLELLYLDDRIELFSMQVQGSGLVHLDDGASVRLTYAGKNGHPYASIARLLVERNALAADEIDMKQVKAWLRADPMRGRALMQENRSYVFFRELSEDEGRDGPLGAEGVALTPGRSLAVDTAYTPLGTPVFVMAPGLENADAPFQRLMIAQDVGSAIRGEQRGDIFWGTGEAAGAVAGRTRHAARFRILLPKR